MSELTDATINMGTRILITGGAGFVGSNLAVCHRQEHPEDQVICLDNLKRPGSELAPERLETAGAVFARGDVRSTEDLEAVGAVDLIIDCAAEASVLAGYDGSPRYLVDTNLNGTFNCLELARRHGAGIIFLSSSRIYAIEALRNLPLEVQGDRLAIPAGRTGPGWSDTGITADFPAIGVRSLYGATKLCSELLIQEYRAAYGLHAVINRCGVISGPWQFGQVEQGFVSLWAARHLFQGRLNYIGFGGHGRQVRDVLHVKDLYDLVRLQIEAMEQYDGEIFNAGGGLDSSTSLKELTDLCEARTGHSIAIDTVPETHPADVPYYVTDNREVTRKTGWKPTRTIPDIVDDILQWLKADPERLAGYF